MRFDACADSYDLHAAPQRAFADRVGAFIQVASGEDVLELGAGTGALSRWLCRHGARLRATDASPRMVALGREAVPEAEWFRLDAFAESLPAASIQVSSGLLQWAECPVETLGRWKLGLRPGGRMIHAVACEPCLAEWRALVPETPLAWRDEAGWRAVFAAAGLRVVRARLWVEEHRFASALELARCLHGSGVTGRARLGPGRLRAAIRRYDGLHRREDKVVSTWAWLALEAVPVQAVWPPRLEATAAMGSFLR